MFKSLSLQEFKRAGNTREIEKDKIWEINSVNLYSIYIFKLYLCHLVFNLPIIPYRIYKVNWIRSCIFTYTRFSIKVIFQRTFVTNSLFLTAQYPLKSILNQYLCQISSMKSINLAKRINQRSTNNPSPHILSPLSYELDQSQPSCWICEFRFKIFDEKFMMAARFISGRVLFLTKFWAMRVESWWTLEGDGRVWGNNVKLEVLYLGEGWGDIGKLDI